MMTNQVLYMLVLVTIFLTCLDHCISIFRINTSPWFLYDGLASRKTKIIKQPAHNGKLGFYVFISKQMGSKVPHPAKAFGTGISSIDIHADFRKCKEECEKEDSEIRECENQRKLQKESKMGLIKFDSQFDKAKFKLFFEKHIDKIVNVVKSARSRKAPRYICDQALDTDHWDQCTKFRVCEKTEEIVQEFCSKHSELKKYFQKRLPTRLPVSRHEVVFACCINIYLEEMDLSLNY